ncbi:MAG: hypothetical protein ACYTDT_13380 [Planctomycetota bacterium]|jgi:hypothetical protein
MKPIPRGYILPSACFALQPKHIRNYTRVDSAPRVGDVVYGRIASIGEHGSLENKQGRIHAIHNGSYAIFVFGNRYATDYYEALVPDEPTPRVDLVARSGVIGKVRQKNALVKEPTQVKILGHVCDEKGNTINTLDHSLVKISKDHDMRKKRAKMILNIGTSMNSGKSTTAKSCCWALTTMGYTVRGAKVTGTASLKDILHMQDAGAEKIADFTHLGYPATYMLSAQECESIFHTLDLKYGNNPKNYWVVEIADGVLQRETEMLLQSKVVRDRIHKLIFSAGDSLGVQGGIQILKEKYGLAPDAISGRCTSSSLGIDEIRSIIDIPVFDNMQWNLRELSEILL